MPIGFLNLWNLKNRGKCRSLHNFSASKYINNFGFISFSFYWNNLLKKSKSFFEIKIQHAVTIFAVTRIITQQRMQILNITFVGSTCFSTISHSMTTIRPLWFPFSVGTMSFKISAFGSYIFYLFPKNFMKIFWNARFFSQHDVYRVIFRDHSFSTHAKVSEKLLFLTLWYTHVHTRT